MINTQKQAVGYIRVTTEEQAREGVSLDAQCERIKALAVAKDWDLTCVIQDRGCSGKDLNRPGVQDLIKRGEAGEIDVVIVYKVDRLTRKQMHLWQFLEDILEPHGVGFISVSEPFDTTTATGKAFLGMLGVLAQLERELIGERTREGLRHKKSNGEWITRVPIGFRMNDAGQLEEDPDGIDQIRRAKRLSREGKSVRDIARTMNLSKNTIHKWLRTDLRTLKSKYIGAL